MFCTNVLVDIFINFISNELSYVPLLFYLKKILAERHKNEELKDVII